MNSRQLVMVQCIRTGLRKEPSVYVFGVAKRVLGNTEGLGENPTQFSVDVLAKLITPDMSVRKELEAVLDLP